MADVLDIDNAEEFEVDDDGDREFEKFNEFHSETVINKILQRAFCGWRKKRRKRRDEVSELSPHIVSLLTTRACVTITKKPSQDPSDVS